MTSELNAPLPRDVAERALCATPWRRLLVFAVAWVVAQHVQLLAEWVSRAAVRPVARVREHRTATPAARHVRTSTVCSVLDDGGGNGTGRDDDDSEAAQGQECAA